MGKNNTKYDIDDSYDSDREIESLAESISDYLPQKESPWPENDPDVAVALGFTALLTSLVPLAITVELFGKERLAIVCIELYGCTCLAMAVAIIVSELSSEDDSELPDKVAAGQEGWSTPTLIPDNSDDDDIASLSPSSSWDGLSASRGLSSKDDLYLDNPIIAANSDDALEHQAHLTEQDFGIILNSAATKPGLDGVYRGKSPPLAHPGGGRRVSKPWISRSPATWGPG